MRKLRILNLILMLLPLCIVLAALPFMSEKIPVHYGFDGQVDRWGSKYETLLFPVLSLLFGIFMLGMARFSAKHEESGTNNETICLTAGAASLGVFTALALYFTYTGLAQVENLNEMRLEINQLMFCIAGVTLMIVGNIMPRSKPNSVLGVRTKWSMKNEVTWKKSQRFGGIAAMACGGAMAVFSLLAKGMACFFFAMALMALMVAADLTYSYQAYKKYGDDQ